MRRSKDAASFLADRRVLLGGLACAAAFASASLAATAVGLVESCLGPAEAESHDVTRALSNGADIFVGDLVITRETARLVMLLGTATRIRMGGNTRLRIDRFLAETRGELRFQLWAAAS